MKLPIIHNVQELETLIREIGFLPMFHSKISGFSLEECTPPDRWFVKGVEGPWEWREAVALKGETAYGKLFNKKTGFVSREWLPDFINYRRNGYDFEGFCEDGLCTFMAKKIMEQLKLRGPLFSHELKQLLGSGKDHKSQIDNALTNLQMLSFMTVDRFDYKLSRDGQPYGWGIAKYTTTENKFGEALVNSKDGTPVQDSKQKMLDHLSKILPEASPKELLEIVG